VSASTSPAAIAVESRLFHALAVLRVVKTEPQVQVTWVST
jgi:hypothetical protein